MAEETTRKRRKDKQITVRLDEESFQMAQEVMEYFGFKTFPSYIRESIALTYAYMIDEQEKDGKHEQ